MQLGHRLIQSELFAFTLWFKTTKIYQEITISAGLRVDQDGERMKKILKELSRQEYNSLYDTGLLFELYPVATGNYWIDCKMKPHIRKVGKSWMCSYPTNPFDSSFGIGSSPRNAFLDWQYR